MLRDTADQPFDFTTHAFLVGSEDDTLASKRTEFLGDGDDLWATKRGTIEMVLNILRVRREVSQVDPDIVHVINPTPVTLAAVLPQLADRPLVVGPNIGSWYPIRSNEVWFHTKLDQVTCRVKYLIRKGIFGAVDPSHALSFSEYHSSMLEMIHIPSEQITPIKPGVNGSIFYPAETAQSQASVPELLYVGDFSDHKGYKIFLKAVSQLSSEVKVRLIGAGNPDPGLIDSLGIEEATTVEGFVDRAALARYYRQADLFVIPSIDEMFPNTQVESLACGTPVIATDAPGMNEIDCSEATRHFWPRTSEALATTLENAIVDLKTLSVAAMRHAGEFTTEGTVNQLETLYKSLLEAEDHT